MTNHERHHGPFFFFTTTLWGLDPDAYPPLKGRCIKYLQILTLVAKDFWDDQCLLRASALSFSTILSLVPFFALTFSVLKGLGVQNKLEPLILDQVAAGSEEIVDKIVTYINNTNMTSLGAIGLVTLVVTVISLLGNIEETFNVVWGVQETRSYYRKFSDYMSVVISGPILLIAATSITTTLQSQAMLKWLTSTVYFGDVLLFFFHLIPYFSISVALVFLYIFIPNTRVRFKSAFLGGLLAGASWQIAQWVYIHFQVGVAKYNAIYGTLAALPVFMVWLYTSWLIVLFGVEVVYAHQNIRTFRREVHGPAMNHALKELLALGILQKISVSFYSGLPPWTEERLAEELSVPARMVRELLSELIVDGYLVKTVAEPPCFQPARDLGQIKLKDVIQTLRISGGLRQVNMGDDVVLKEFVTRISDSVEAALDGTTLEDLATLTLAKMRPIRD